MKKYNITVNGTTYEVVVEEVGEVISAPAYSAPIVSAATTSTAASKPTSSASTPAAGENAVKAPMPGTILEIKVSAGQAVKKGDVICVLEAMKMENDIPAPRDGIVASISVQKGASVATDDVIATIN